MKHINFITTLTPQQQYEIRRWFIVSSLITAITLIAISCYFVPQLYALYTVKKEISLLKMKTQEHATLTNTKDTLKKEHEALQQKIQIINNYMFSPKNPHASITSIMNACNTIKVESIRTNDQDIELIALFPSTEHATTITQLLSDTGHFVNVKINSLHYDNKNKQFTATIKFSMLTTNQ